MWSEEDERRLKALRMASARHTREKLAQLVEHFKQGGTLFSVTDKDKPVHASQEFARKVRNLTREGKLDWLLGGQMPGITVQDGLGTSVGDDAGQPFLLSWELLEGSTGIPEHTCDKKTIAIMPSYHGDEFGVAVACFPEDQEAVYVEVVELLAISDLGSAFDRIAELAAHPEVSHVVTDDYDRSTIVQELARRGVRCYGEQWANQHPRSLRDKHHRYQLFKDKLRLDRLHLVDDPRLSLQLSKIRVSPSETSPGFVVWAEESTSIVDAAVLAATAPPTRRRNIGEPKKSLWREPGSVTDSSRRPWHEYQ